MTTTRRKKNERGKKVNDREKEGQMVDSGIRRDKILHQWVTRDVATSYNLVNLTQSWTVLVSVCLACARTSLWRLLSAGRFTRCRENIEAKISSCVRPYHRHIDAPLFCYKHRHLLGASIFFLLSFKTLTSTCGSDLRRWRASLTSLKVTKTSGGNSLLLSSTAFKRPYI